MASPSRIISWSTDFLALENDIDDMRWHGSRFECDLLYWPLVSHKSVFSRLWWGREGAQRAFSHAIKTIFRLLECFG